jgi:hypothetical protein
MLSYRCCPDTRIAPIRERSWKLRPTLLFLFGAPFYQNQLRWILGNGKGNRKNEGVFANNREVGSPNRERRTSDNAKSRRGTSSELCIVNN